MSHRRLACTLAALSLVLGSCSSYKATFGDSPGTNVEVGGIAIRYAHLQDPADPDGYEPGDDVPLYVWVYNESGKTASLTGASSPVAEDVVISEGSFPVDLPREEFVELGPERAYLVLQDIDRQVRGAELIPVTLTFGDGREAVMRVEAIAPDPDWPALPTTS